MGKTFLRVRREVGGRGEVRGVATRGNVEDGGRGVLRATGGWVGGGRRMGRGRRRMGRG